MTVEAAQRPIPLSNRRGFGSKTEPARFLRTVGAFVAALVAAVVVPGWPR